MRDLGAQGVVPPVVAALPTQTGSGAVLRLSGDGELYEDRGGAWRKVRSGDMLKATYDANGDGIIDPPAVGAYGMRLSGPASTQYALIVTLPTSAGNTYAKAVFEVRGGNWDGNGRRVDRYLLGNRGSFDYTWESIGSAATPFGVSAYQRATGELDIYVYAPANTYMAGVLSGYLLADQTLVITPFAPPVFSGTAPTGTLMFDSAFSLPTVASVPNAVNVSSAYTAAPNDAYVFASAATAAFTVTLPTAAGRAGKTFVVKKTDTSRNAVTLATTGGQTIDGGATAVLSAPYTALTVASDGSNWQVI